MRLELARGLSTASLDLNKFSAKLVYILYYFRVTLQNAPYKNNRGGNYCHREEPGQLDPL